MCPLVHIQCIYVYNETRAKIYITILYRNGWIAFEKRKSNQGSITTAPSGSQFDRSRQNIHPITIKSIKKRNFTICPNL